MAATKLTALAITIGPGLAHLSWLVASAPAPGCDRQQVENQALACTASDAFRAATRNRRGHDPRGDRVDLIDSLDQRFHPAPEVSTTHGDLLVRLLRAGGGNTGGRTLNAALSKGLAQVIGDSADGDCAAARFGADGADRMVSGGSRGPRSWCSGPVVPTDRKHQAFRDGRVNRGRQEAATRQKGSCWWKLLQVSRQRASSISS